MSASQPQPADAQALRRLFGDHSRQWRDFAFVYPVISRRSRGLSIGVNLNPDRACNFDCVYCSVDRREPSPRREVDLDQLARELEAMVDLATTGELWNDPAFAATPEEYRRINDIAFSGDGEPTTFAGFERAVELAAALKATRGLASLRLVLITNATALERPAVVRALERLDAAGGEVWAKLDAGDPELYRAVDRSRTSYEKILGNLLACGRRRPIVIQSLFLRLRGQAPTDAQIDAYAQRLAELQAGGCQIRAVHVYTVARRTAEDFAAPLENDRLDAIAAAVTRRNPALQVETFYGVG